MQTKTDTELLREYAACRSEAAFGEIVRRYADFVYSAALRQVGDPEQARDVAQGVFVDLARKASSLRANTLLIGWLCRGARLAALEQLRTQHRRLKRERQAMELMDPSPEIPNDWSAIRPVLDEAIVKLRDEDRNALLLRFFKNESLASVGATLGVSEDAAQKRVSRALTTLRKFLAERGITTSTAALSVALASNAIQAAPAGFAASLAADALETAAGSATGSILKILTLNSMKTAIMTVALAGGLVALTVKQINTRKQLRETQSVVLQQEDELEAVRALNQQLASQTNELESLRAAQHDLPRLRGENARLRREQAERKIANLSGQTEPNTTPDVGGQPVLIEGKFISVPTGNLKAVAQFQGNPGGNGGVTTLAGDSELRAMLQTLAKTDGMETLSSPRIQTANGVEALVSVTEHVQFSGTNVDVGTVLDLNPHYSTNSPSITVDMTATLRQVIDISPQQDESLRGLQVTTLTNSASVLDGQSILLRQDIPSEGRVIGSTNLVAGPKSLLIILTPHILKADGSYQRLERIVQLK
jgi:RNA polymerase sigma factor (sigma-70 family)